MDYYNYSFENANKRPTTNTNSGGIIHHVNINSGASSIQQQQQQSGKISKSNHSQQFDDCLLEYAREAWKEEYRTQHDYSGWLSKRGKGEHLYLIESNTFRNIS